jgi:hypothetical protein
MAWRLAWDSQTVLGSGIGAAIFQGQIKAIPVLILQVLHRL